MISNSSFDISKIITIFISVFSLLISIVTFIRSWWVERFKIDFEMVKWFGCNDSEHPFYVWLYVTNMSKLPLSILELKIENNRNGTLIHGCGNGAKKFIALSKSSSIVPTETYSLGYPVNIAPYSTVGGYFHIYSGYAYHNFEDDNVKITIRTNRGAKSKIIYMDYGKNIFRVIQYKDESTPQITGHSDGSPIIYLSETDI